MKDFLIIFGVGFLTFIAGILLLKREIRLFKDCITTDATVVDYYSYTSDHRLTMYTMAVEYRLSDGTTIHASEQKGSNNQKYPVGSRIEIVYSEEKPEMFNVKGDNSRKYVMAGMIIVGLAMSIISVLFALGYLVPAQ